MGGYIKSLIDSVPIWFYEVALSAFILCMVLLISIKGYKKGLYYCFTVALIEYIAFIYCSTVVFRQTLEKRMFEYHPFWSYSSVFNGSNEHLGQIVMNIVVFIPLGFLLGSSLKNSKLPTIIIAGLIISASIEILQFVFKKGFSETDDLFNNVLGCILGFSLYKIISYIIHRDRRYK